MSRAVAVTAPMHRGSLRAPGPVLLPVLLVCGGVLAQIAFPLTGGGTLPLTIAAVTLLAAGAVTHAAVTYGGATAVGLVVVAGLGGLLAEYVGVSTGVPFGDYAYSGTLGPQPLGVPVIVPMAWVMMAWPALHVGRLLAVRRLPRVLLGAWALTAWDVFLDPQMVDAGHWTWTDPTPALPGVEGVPLTNFAGWLLVSFLVVGLLDAVVEVRRPVPVLPLAVYTWTFLSSVMAHAVFFGRPPVALVGGLLMGVVGVPVALHLWTRWRER